MSRRKRKATRNAAVAIRQSASKGDPAEIQTIVKNPAIVGETQAPEDLDRIAQENLSALKQQKEGSPPKANDNSSALDIAAVLP